MVTADNAYLDTVKKDIDYYKQQILARSRSQELILCVNDKPVMLPVRMPAQGEHVIIDYINFVVKMSDLEYKFTDDLDTYTDLLHKIEEDYQMSDFQKDKERHAIFEYITGEVGKRLASIFGEDLDDIFSNLLYTGKGLHHYKYCFDIGTRENTLGKVCFGGQNGTCLIMINGFGCSMACTGWERGLYDFLTSCRDARITRIDLAHDDFKGAYSSAESCNDKESEGYFYISGTQPKVQQLGDWKRHMGDGRTLQIGKRQNGKMFRGYEKGKQLGDKESPWFRCEVELRNQSRLIPFEILLTPTEYFSGFYPYTSELIEFAICEQSKNAKDNQNPPTETKATRIPLITKTGEISLKKSLEIWRKQIGRYIKAYRQLFNSDTDILDLLETKKNQNYYPKRLAIFEKFKSGEFCASLASHPLMYAH